MDEEIVVRCPIRVDPKVRERLPDFLEIGVVVEDPPYDIVYVTKGRVDGADLAFRSPPGSTRFTVLQEGFAPTSVTHGSDGCGSVELSPVEVIYGEVEAPCEEVEVRCTSCPRPAQVSDAESCFFALNTLSLPANLFAMTRCDDGMVQGAAVWVTDASAWHRVPHPCTEEPGE